LAGWVLTGDLDASAADRLTERITHASTEMSTTSAREAVDNAFDQFRSAGVTGDGAWVLALGSAQAGPILAGGRLSVSDSDFSEVRSRLLAPGDRLPAEVLSRQVVQQSDDTAAVVDLVGGRAEPHRLFNRFIGVRTSGDVVVKLEVSTSDFSSGWDISANCLALLGAVEVEAVGAA
jgi:hypothetical protein